MTIRDEDFYADAKMIAAAVREEVGRAAYLATGGSYGCAQCTRSGKDPMTFRERIDRGHLDCAETLAASTGAKRTADGMGEVWITISRVMEDPRFGQWLQTTCKET